MSSNLSNGGEMSPFTNFLELAYGGDRDPVGFRLVARDSFAFEYGGELSSATNFFQVAREGERNSGDFRLAARDSAALE